MLTKHHNSLALCSLTIYFCIYTIQFVYAYKAPNRNVDGLIVIHHPLNIVRTIWWKFCGHLFSELHQVMTFWCHIKEEKNLWAYFSLFLYCVASPFCLMCNFSFVYMFQCVFRASKSFVSFIWDWFNDIIMTYTMFELDLIAWRQRSYF